MRRKTVRKKYRELPEGRDFERGREELLDRKAGELMADELLQAQNALAEITGEFSSDDLLGKIFGSFCIGK